MGMVTLGLVYFVSYEPPKMSIFILEVIIYCVPTVCLIPGK